MKCLDEKWTINFKWILCLESNCYLTFLTELELELELELDLDFVILARVVSKNRRKISIKAELYTGQC